FHGVKPRVVENVVGFVIQVDGLLHAPGVDAGQAAHGQGEVPVRAGVIDGPVGAALTPVQAGLELPVGLQVVRQVHEAGEAPLAGDFVIGRYRKVVVLPGRI